jgi:hypothetical protein
MNALKGKGSRRWMDIDYSFPLKYFQGRVTVPDAVTSISTDSLTRKNNVLGFFIPQFA